MTTTFDDRERGYENKFAHDQEVEFKISARMAHLVGLWAAEKINLASDAAEAYADRLVELVVKKNFKTLIAEQLQKDFTNAGLAIDIKSIIAEIEKLAQVATKQIANVG